MNKARRRALILFFASFAFGAIPIRTSAAGPGRAECRSIPSAILGHPVAYCVILPSNYDIDKAVSYPVLYFLHGLGGNEQLLLNSGGMDLIQDLRDQKKIGEFLVVTPNGGRTFYINSRDGKVRYEDFLVREFIPYIESHYRIRAGRKTRGITGVSMGGYGSLYLALRHPNLFGAVSAHSPALIEKLPKMQGSSQQATTVAMILGGAFGSPIDPAFWERESPFTIVSTGPRPTGLQIYFDCGTDDEYGFNRGAQQFHDLL
ncbi:MAG TPA: alpha/beta hydrolase-fold protein, partial [Candidatus Acidoferrales bacterium]|nr:alpha/beta hydrolase-fold protein [Candidatus Acidoferrales bacterium]